MPDAQLTASNNEFPKVILVAQGSAPATPAPGQQKLFIRASDDHLCRVDDTGTVVDLEAATSPPVRVGAVGLIIDGGGSAITTGVKGFVRVPFAATITGVTVLSTDAAVTSGSIVIDVWKDTYANYPPTVADTITASAKPTLSSATKSEDTTLTGWTTAIAAGDVLGFKVDSASTVTKVLVTLTVQAT